jgi:AraC-like DNA-binding protein
MRDIALLRDLALRHAPDDGVHETAIHGLALIRSSRQTEPLHLLHQPALCLIVQGAKRVRLAEQAYDYGTAEYLVVSVDLPVSGHVTTASAAEPYLCIRVDIDTAILASVAAELPAGRPSQAAEARGLFLSPTTPELAEAVLRLVRLVERPDDIAFLAPLALREVYYRLLHGAQGTAVRQIAAAGSQLERVARAIARIKANYAEPLRIAELAEHAHMSPSALHQHFKAVTAMSPLQYQKRIRLQEARERMVAHGIDAATAGYQVGYDSPSQFTREYRRLFGDPPARDAARLRAQMTGVVVP